MIMKKMSLYERECADNYKLFHSLVFVENYKHGYLEKLTPLAYSDTFADKDFIAVCYSICWAHGIDITRIDLTWFRNEVKQFYVSAD